MVLLGFLLLRTCGWMWISRSREGVHTMPVALVGCTANAWGSQRTVILFFRRWEYFLKEAAFPHSRSEEIAKAMAVSARISGAVPVSGIPGRARLCCPLGKRQNDPSWVEWAGMQARVSMAMHPLVTTYR